MRPILLAVAVLLLSAPPGRARGEAAQPAPAPPGAGEPQPQLERRPDLDRLLAAPPPAASDRAFEEQVDRRRTLLTAHQAAGLATWGLMGATVVVGQLNYNDLYGGGGYTQKYREAHVALASATAATFAFTGILALAAPRPYPTRPRLDTATIHKVAMGLTTLGLASQIVLGVVTHHTPTSVEQLRLAQAHQALGYATFGTMTIGAVTLLF